MQTPSQRYTMFLQSARFCLAEVRKARALGLRRKIPALLEQAAYHRRNAREVVF